MAKSPTIISASTSVKGRIHGQENVEVYGKVEGQIELDGELLIDTNARADADIQATVVTVQGVVVGDTVASASIHLESSAKVIGDLSAPRIVIDEGAQVRGLVETGENAGSGRGSQARPKRAAAPAKARPTRPTKATAPTSDVEDAGEADDDDEPELPTSARKKKVAVKKRS